MMGIKIQSELTACPEKSYNFKAQSHNYVLMAFLPKREVWWKSPGNEFAQSSLSTTSFSFALG